jgi:MoaA/NifB/PqqE/SkfB family radical SAM enzyme
LENSESQINREISLDQKKRLILHLYENFNFRSLTLSGGEALQIGNEGTSDFISLTEFLKQFKSVKRENNLRLNLYSNGLKLNEMIINRMDGVFDEISINIDSSSKSILQKIGRNANPGDDYLRNILRKLKLLSESSIGIKLHTVISSINRDLIGEEVMAIYEKIAKANIKVSSWKFYQYMSYDIADVDQKHQISLEQFFEISQQIKERLIGSVVSLQFKDNREMKDSIFNILAYGNAQYLTPEETWSTSSRTKPLWEYSSLNDMFMKTRISRELFEKYHQIHY